MMAAGPGVASFQDSFLGPYLPATLSGSNAALRTPDLAALSVEYLPPVLPGVREEYNDFNAGTVRPPRYSVPAPIAPAATRPVLFVGLRSKPGAKPLTLPGSESRLMGVEWQVGRGRVLMLAFNSLDPVFAAGTWPGMDTFMRRVLLSRPEETQGKGPDNRFQYDVLGGPGLTRVATSLATRESVRVWPGPPSLSRARGPCRPRRSPPETTRPRNYRCRSRTARDRPRPLNGRACPRPAPIAPDRECRARHRGKKRVWMYYVYLTSNKHVLYRFSIFKARFRSGFKQGFDRT